MNRKVITSLLVIGLAVVAIIGGTLAWFTWEAEIGPNEFTAGKLEIDAKETWDYADEGFTNWNPGQCVDKEITVEVTGTKKAFIRVLITEEWTETKDGDYDDETHERNIENVHWSIGEVAWPGTPANWQMLTTSDGTYWYYKGKFDPDQSTADGRVPAGPKEVTVLSKVCLDGEDTGNEYQGATYTLAMNFEAIQTTHEASNNAWGVYWDATAGEWKEVEEED